MSTRCMVVFQEDEFPTLNPPEVQLYQHGSGDPYNVVKDLTDFLTKWNKARGDGFEAGAMAAHFVNFTLDRDFRGSTQRAASRLKKAKARGDKWSIEMAEDAVKNAKGEYRYSGFRIVPHNEFHDDIEWYYIVTPLRVHVYHTQHNKHADFNDFEDRTNKNNWIVVSSRKEELSIRAGKYPKRYNTTTSQALWYQEAQKYAEEQEAQRDPILPGMHEAMSLSPL